MPLTFTGVGAADLLERPLVGLVVGSDYSREMLVKTIDQLEDWKEAGKVVVTGLHTRLEKQVLSSLLRRRSPVVKVLARGMTHYRPRPNEALALEQGRMLVITVLAPGFAFATNTARSLGQRLITSLAPELYKVGLEEE
jgi:predicted Rossmann fold nucleotide-binding protein DprA/Smf involved in DNA uptake